MFQVSLHSRKSWIESGKSEYIYWKQAGLYNKKPLAPKRFEGLMKLIVINILYFMEVKAERQKLKMYTEKFKGKDWKAFYFGTHVLCVEQES